MSSLFGKAVKELTFKAKVQDFWTWYESVASRYFSVVDAGKSDTLVAEVSSRVDALSGFAWVFGPGEGGKGHSFTLSGEGVLDRQLLTQFWKSQAPAITGWTFYAAHQPGDVDRIQLDGKMFNSNEFWLVPSLDRERQKIDITIWHPLFAGMSAKDRSGPTFLFLDAALGEYGTEQWVGKINIQEQDFANAIPLKELVSYTKKIGEENGWKKLPPGEASVLYRIGQPHGQFLRGDIVGGTTMHPRLINEYLAARGELSDPLAGTGADYVFITFDAGILPKGSQVSFRGKIEDALNERLRATASGRLLGGALGAHNAYIDLMLFDGVESLNLVQNVLTEQQLPHGTAIHYFAKEKRGHRVVI